MVYPQYQAIMKVVDLILQKCGYHFLYKNKCNGIIYKIRYYHSLSPEVRNTSSNTCHVIKKAVAICKRGMNVAIFGHGAIAFDMQL